MEDLDADLPPPLILLSTRAAPDSTFIDAAPSYSPTPPAYCDFNCSDVEDIDDDLPPPLIPLSDISPQPSTSESSSPCYSSTPAAYCVGNLDDGIELISDDEDENLTAEVIRPTVMLGRSSMIF